MSSLTRSVTLPWNSAGLDGAAHAPDRKLTTTSFRRRTECRTVDRLRPLVKRSVDLTGALFGLLLLSPVLVAVALLIRLDSPGPVLFRQVRAVTEAGRSG